MGYASDRDSSSILQRIFIYGLGKMRKTWWACKAAEHGYNVLLHDADRGSKVVENLTKEAQKRVFILDAQDTQTHAHASRFLMKLVKSHRLWWNDDKKVYSDMPMRGQNVADIDLRKYNSNTIFVCDSWSAICASLVHEYADRESIDLLEGEKTEWDGYAWEGRIATILLNKLKNLPCHIIVIGHETTYEKYRGTGKQRQLISSRVQPKSTSNPHGQTISDKFDEMYRFFKKGPNNFIDVEGHIYKDAGSRTLPPKENYKWDELQFVDLAGRPQEVLPPRDWFLTKSAVSVATQEASNIKAEDSGSSEVADSKPKSIIPADSPFAAFLSQ